MQKERNCGEFAYRALNVMGASRDGLETLTPKTETSALETETFGRSAETRPWIGL